MSRTGRVVPKGHVFLSFLATLVLLHSASCSSKPGGAAYADGRIFYNTLDAHTVAVDAATGKLVWKTQVGDINKGESVTMAPLVVKGKVLVGNSGGEFGVRGWLTALNASDGTVAWKAYTTGP